MNKKRYLEQPVLNNPVRWLGLNNFHSSELKLRDYYDVGSLENNPLATFLIDTKMDGTKKRFPKGQMIRLILDSNPGISPALNSTQKNHYLVPCLEESRIPRVLSPSHYILNNKKYIEYIVKTKQWKRFVPLKFTFKNGNTFESKIELLPNFEEIIESTLKSNVKHLLNSRLYKEIKEHDRGLSSNGLIVDSKSSKKLIEISNSRLVISIGCLGINGRKDPFKLFVPYLGNNTLCTNLIKLAFFIKR